jgi:hypothetical protein
LREREKRRELDATVHQHLVNAVAGLDDDALDQLDIAEVAGDAFRKGASETAANLVGALYDDAPRMLAEHRGIDARWRLDIRGHWGEALDVYRMLWVACHEVGATVSREHVPGTETYSDLIHALVGLHARASRVALEVQTLLENGLGQGALARARTLHELAVTSGVLTAPAEKVAREETATRFIAHQAIGSYLDTKKYQEVAERIEYKPFGDPAMQKMKQARDDLEDRYGREFCKPNGWASELNDGRAPRFIEMERIAKFDHLRSHYNWASHEVHADAVAWRQNISSWQGKRYLVSGRAPDGLADPGHMAAISLLNITLTLINNQSGGPDAESLTVMNTLMRLCDDVGDRFIEAHRRVDEQRKRQPEPEAGPTALPPEDSTSESV